jgi:hypothetical protein
MYSIFAAKVIPCPQNVMSELSEVYSDSDDMLRHWLVTSLIKLVRSKLFLYIIK